MGATTSVLPDSLAVEPGHETSCIITIRNNGDVVDEFDLEILGDASAWTEVEPRTLSLYPGTEREVELTFRPPRLPSTPAGQVPFGVHVRSQEDPESSHVEEGRLEVAAFEATAAEVFPRNSHGRLAGKHEIAVDNRGNATLDAVVHASDPDGLLSFTIKPPAFAAAPGTATFAKLRVRPRKRFLRGPAKTLPFQVQVQPEGAAPLTLDGAVVQEALLPRWTLAAALGLIGLAALWALALKPKIESTAKDAVKAPLAAQAKQVHAAATQAADAKKQADAAVAQVSGASSNGGGGGSNGGASNGNGTGGAGKPVETKVVVNTPDRGTPTSLRLQVDCSTTCTKDFSVPAGQTLSVTDIVLGNPQGDTGTLTLKRDDDVILTESLANFRDLDFHFVAPIVLAGGQKLRLETACDNARSLESTSADAAGDAAAAGGPCTAAALIGGFAAKTAAKKP
jgi:hypothetical protein